MPAPELSLVPSLTFADASKAIDFYQKAFGAEVDSVMRNPHDNSVMHAAIRIGGGTLYLGDDMMGRGRTVEAGYAAACTPTLQVPDADATFQKAIDAGCQEDMPLEDAFWGDRYGQLKDPFGLVWAVLSPHEEVSREEVERRAKEMFGKGKPGGDGQQGASA